VFKVSKPAHERYLQVGQRYASLVKNHLPGL